MINISVESLINREFHRVVLLVSHNHDSNGYAIDETAPRYSSTWETREVVGVEFFVPRNRQVPSWSPHTQDLY